MKPQIHVLLLCFFVSLISNGQAYFTTGIKIGEVSDTSAIIQTRLCAVKKPIAISHERKAAPMRHPVGFNNDTPISEMDGAVPGQKGRVRMTLRNGQQVFKTKWLQADGSTDYIVKENFTQLSPNTTYEVILEGKESGFSKKNIITGSFTTAPAASLKSTVTFTVSSCQYFWDFDDPDRGFKAYDAMSALQPAFHCQTGDYVYYDKPGPLAYTVEQARHKWSAMNGWQSLVDFYNQTPLYIQKDDHDVLKDDASPYSSAYGNLSFDAGIKIWYEQMPTRKEFPFRTFRWGENLQLWFVEGREFRSDNAMTDSEQKTIWGDKQKEWLVESMKASDATFKLLISPTPVVGPDRAKGKDDNHSNEAFTHEGSWLRKFLSSQKHTYVICGDRHWQYVSKDSETGLFEFSSGATSDEHAQGWNPEDILPEHQFLRVEGGFLAVTVNEDKSIAFTHYDVDGKKVNEVIVEK
jgi:alkaline phosphatase D